MDKGGGISLFMRMSLPEENQDGVPQPDNHCLSKVLEHEYLQRCKGFRDTKLISGDVQCPLHFPTLLFAPSVNAVSFATSKLLLRRVPALAAICSMTSTASAFHSVSGRTALLVQVANFVRLADCLHSRAKHWHPHPIWSSHPKAWGRHQEYLSIFEISCIQLLLPSRW